MANWRGTWAGGTAYAAGDSVNYSGTAYYCLIGNTGHTPGTDGDWTTMDSFIGSPAGGGSVIDGVAVTGTPSSGQVVTATSATAAHWAAAATGTGLTRTAVKTGAYSAAAGDFVPCDTTSAAFTVTLPTPANNAVVAVKLVILGGSNAVTVARSGSDVFNKAGGSTSMTLSRQFQTVWLQYTATGAIWSVISTDPAGVTSVAATDTSIVAGGTASAPTLATGTLDVIATQHPPAAAWSNNSKKITSVANGSGAQDAAAFGQIPLLDATATDILAAGTQAAGSSTKAAAADHVHPSVLAWPPSAMGLLVTNYDDPAIANTTSLTTAGTVYLMRLNIYSALTITNICFNLFSNAAGASTQSFVGLYNSSGSLLSGSSDIGSSLTSGASVMKSLALTTAQPLAAGTFVWAAVLTNMATTQPLFAKGPTLALFNVGCSIASGNIRAATYTSTSQTALPGTITPTSQMTLTGGLPFWCGAS